MWIEYRTIKGVRQPKLLD